MNGAEFIRRWGAGEYTDVADASDYPELMRLAMLIPLAGRSPAEAVERPYGDQGT